MSCPPDHIINPLTARCVKNTGVIGKFIRGMTKNCKQNEALGCVVLAKKPSPTKKPSPAKKPSSSPKISTEAMLYKVFLEFHKTHKIDLTEDANTYIISNNNDSIHLSGNKKGYFTKLIFKQSNSLPEKVIQTFQPFKLEDHTSFPVPVKPEILQLVENKFINSPSLNMPIVLSTPREDVNVDFLNDTENTKVLYPALYKLFKLRAKAKKYKQK
jgi:hypothetical protein